MRQYTLSLPPLFQSNLMSSRAGAKVELMEGIKNSEFVLTTDMSDDTKTKSRKNETMIDICSTY